MSPEICPACGAAAAPWATAVDRNRRLTDERFAYARCESCGLIFLTNVPEDLGRYYPDEYYEMPPSRAALVAGAAPHDAYKIELLRPLAASGRLVEVGPAIGGFAALAQDAGYDVSAIEMDARASDFLRDVVGVPTVTTDDTAAALAAGGPYDVIAMWHVVEHLLDPRTTLAAAAQALRPGGILLVAAPNPEALQLRLFGRRWTHLDAPRHVSLIPLGVLERWAAELDLDVELMTTTDPGTLGWNRFGWTETLAHSVRSVKGGHALRMVGRALAALAAPLERRGRHGTTYTVALRRRR